MKKNFKTKDEAFNYILDKVLPDENNLDYDPGDVVMRVRELCCDGLNIKEKTNLENAATELLKALVEAKEMLIASGLKEDSVALIGINLVIKKATE